MYRLASGCAALTIVAAMSGQLLAADKSAARQKFSELSAAVQKTFEEEAKPAKVESVSEETFAGKPVYVAYVQIDGTHYGIKVAKDGNLIEKVLDLDGKNAEVEVSTSDLPPTVKLTLENESKKGTLGTLLKTTTDGKVLYGASVTIGEKPYWITIAEDGVLHEKRLDIPVMEEEIELGSTPAAVRTALKDEAGSATIDSVSKSTEGNTSIYRADVAINGKTYELVVDEKGTLVDKRLLIEPDRDLIHFADCPAKVKKGLQDEARGDEIDLVGRESEDGKSVYTIEAKIGGKIYEIMVGDDGKLVSKVWVDESELNAKP